MLNFQDVSIKGSVNSSLTAIEHRDITNDVTFSRWKVERNSVVYCRNEGHTLSMYLAGGHNTYRTDQRSNKGATGTLCLMPQGHESRWHVNDKLELAHFYFSDNSIKQYAVQYLDMDARQSDLKDLVYQQDTELTTLLNLYILSHQHMSESSLHSEQILHNMFTLMLQRYTDKPFAKSPMVGGLSSSHRRKVRDFILSHLHCKITIASLAELVGLSPYHFAHMFKLSMGFSPAQFVLLCRIDRARQLLATEVELSEIALSTGFYHQSHLSSYFKRHIGVTPAAYRKYIS